MWIHWIQERIVVLVSDVADIAPVCYPTYYELTILDGDLTYFNSQGTYYFQQQITCTDADSGDSLNYVESVTTGTASDWDMIGSVYLMIQNNPPSPIKVAYVQTIVRSLVFPNRVIFNARHPPPPPLCVHFGLDILTFGLGPQPGNAAFSKMQPRLKNCNSKNATQNCNVQKCNLKSQNMPLKNA